MALRSGQRPRSISFNLESGRRESLGTFQGMVFAPRFSPDGGKVVFSVERGGNSDIYVMNLSSRSLHAPDPRPRHRHLGRRSRPTARASPSTPTGAARPQLYVMGADGSAARGASPAAAAATPRRSGARPANSSPSPSRTGGEFHIGVMRPDGSDERLLTSSYLDEGPTWAPNGRVLMFSRETPGGSA